MLKKKNVILGASMAGLLAAVGTVNAQVILCPDSTADDVFVLDAATGDMITSFDLSGVVSTPIECIDGPGDTLLISDQINDMVYQLGSDGTYFGEYLTASVDNLRGIDLLPNGLLVGASAGGLFVWNQDGDQTNYFKDGDYFDANGALKGYMVTSELALDNLIAYSTKNGNMVGETPPGEVSFPEQNALIKTGDGKRIAVNSFSDNGVYVYNLDGTLDYFFPALSGGRGIIQLDNGNLLLSNGSGISEWTVDGTKVRDVLSGGSFRFFSRSNNYQ